MDTRVAYQLRKWNDLIVGEPDLIAETKKLTSEKSVEANGALYRSLFAHRIQFGTAGLRAKMGIGFSRMNVLTVVQATQGLVNYIKRPETSSSSKLIVIGFDGRHNSRTFALKTAGVFLENGFDVAMFGAGARKLVPTPLVPFAVLELGCLCGIMITASHNPKEYNGYKLYWSNGVQITSPIDAGIEAEIESLKEKPIYLSDDDVLLKVQDVYDRITIAYLEKVAELSFHRQQNRTGNGFVYTAMHGVGYELVERVFERFGFKPLIPVDDQIMPDPEFPTVAFPNPEEGAGAFELSFKKADEHGISVILANDPDADRLAVAIKTSEWHILNGNEIAALLAWWMLSKYGASSDTYMIRSTVSSSLIDSMGVAEGFRVCETLTGFKWIGNKVDQLIKDGKKVVFAYEEAIGFMCGTTVLDKDGVSAAAVFAEMANHVMCVEKISLLDRLDQIYAKYGFHPCDNSYYISEDPSATQRMFYRLRHYDDETVVVRACDGIEYRYPRACGQYKIDRIRDLTAGLQFIVSSPDTVWVPELPSSTSAEMITFSFVNGVRVTIRTSGTEPKIKYYSELKGTPGSTKESIRRELSDVLKQVVEHFYQPSLNGFSPKPN